MFNNQKDSRISFIEKGCALYNSGRYVEAIAYYDQALALDDKSKYLWEKKSNTWYRRGVELDRIGLSSEALECYGEVIKCFESALALDDQDKNIWYRKGTVLDRLSRFDEASECYKKVLALDDKDLAQHDRRKDIWYLRGIVLRKLGDLRHYWWGDSILRKLGCYEEAIKCYDDSIFEWCDYKDKDVLYWKCFALTKLGRYVEAITCSDQALALGDDGCDFWRLRRDVLSKLGRDEEATECSNKALALMLDGKKAEETAIKLPAVSATEATPGLSQNIGTIPIHIDGLIYEPVPGNGHCLYHAIGLYCNESQDWLRQFVATYLEENLDTYVDFIAGLLPSSQTIENYIVGIRNGEEWADHIEIEILMRVLNRPIVIIGPNGNIQNPGQEEQFKGDPIFVYYNGHNHYDALLLDPEYKGSSRGLLQQLTRDAAANKNFLTSQNTELELEILNKNPKSSKTLNSEKRTQMNWNNTEADQDKQQSPETKKRKTKEESQESLSNQEIGVFNASALFQPRTQKTTARSKEKKKHFEH